MSAGENILVVCRFRPANKIEQERGQICARFPEEGAVKIETPAGAKSFSYVRSKKIQEHSSQERKKESKNQRKKECIKYAKGIQRMNEWQLIWPFFFSPFFSPILIGSSV